MSKKCVSFRKNILWHSNSLLGVVYFLTGSSEGKVIVAQTRSANSSPQLPQRPPRPASHEEPLLNNNMAPYTSVTSYATAPQPFIQSRRLPSSHESLHTCVSMDPEPLTLNVATRTNSYPPYVGTLVAPPSYTLYPPTYTSIDATAQFWTAVPHATSGAAQTYYIYRP